MSHFKDYSDDNPPKRGNAKKIYSALKKRGYTVRDLHYNPNNWGNCPDLGWGTWACEIRDDTELRECFCGISEGQVYLQKNRAPYTVIWL